MLFFSVGSTELAEVARKDNFWTSATFSGKGNGLEPGTQATF